METKECRRLGLILGWRNLRMVLVGLGYYSEKIVGEKFCGVLKGASL